MIERRIPLFGYLEIETSSFCNRTCEGCIRNSHPDKQSIAPWFDQAQLDIDVINRILQEAASLGALNAVCLQHYNEPLLDVRLADIAKHAKNLGFKNVFICSNADYMTQEIATVLDGNIDLIYVALYMPDQQKRKREEWLRSLFNVTKLSFTGGDHIATHYSTAFPVESLSVKNSGLPCNEPLRRMIINHRGDMMMCCDDVIGNFNLGNIANNSLEQLWFSDRHQKLVLDLQKSGGRASHQYCITCPRG